VNCGPAVHAVSGRPGKRRNRSRGWWTPAAGRWPGKSRSITAVTVGSLFFPQSRVLGIEPDDTLSPGAMRKVVYMGANASSFHQAECDLKAVGELSISEQRVRRVTERIGQERIEQRDEAVKRWRALPLPQQQRSPHNHIPSLAVVQVDGGRIQIRHDDEPPPDADSGKKPGHWRETKAAVLLRMHSKVHERDPCPELPDSFANVARMAQLSREIKGFSAASVESPSAREAHEQERPERPLVLTSNVVAMRRRETDFGANVAAAAWESGFAGATRKAFVADGLASNWTVWRRYFSHYTPVLDFVHAACYVFNAAAAGRPLDDVAGVYRQWAQWTWSGDVDQVIQAVEARQQELGPPQPGDAETHPRRVLAEALGYLRNQRSRMQYAEYRRQGLPITSAYIESAIKQLNRRVKGSEKFWGTDGAEALLQLRADHLSDRAPLDQFWRDRPAHATGYRCYR
jgi:hypothetical protein